MADPSGHNRPKLHNATWPGVVGKGPDAEEPFIDLDTMLELTAKAEVNGIKFEGFDESGNRIDLTLTDRGITERNGKTKARGLSMKHCTARNCMTYRSVGSMPITHFAPASCIRIA